jgi:uncharacterized protein DUF4383
LAKTYVMVLGVVLVLIGILGFVSPLTPNDQLLGIFETGTAQNLVYLVSGIVALAAVAGGARYARLFAKVFGLIYGLVTVVGFAIGEGDVLGFINVNQADNVLHLAIAASALYAGFASGSKAQDAHA